MPSVAPEAFGLSAAEAMAAGVPVVASDAGALREVLGPGHPWVTAAGDPVALRAGVEAWLDAGADGRAEVAAAQHDRWRLEYSPVAGRERVAALLRDLRVHPA